MKVRYTMQVNMNQMEMLLKAIEALKVTNPDIQVSLDYEALKRQITPVNQYMRRVKGNE